MYDCRSERKNTPPCMQFNEIGSLPVIQGNITAYQNSCFREKSLIRPIQQESGIKADLIAAYTASGKTGFPNIIRSHRLPGK